MKEFDAFIQLMGNHVVKLLTKEEAIALINDAMQVTQRFEPGSLMQTRFVLSDGRQVQVLSDHALTYDDNQRIQAAMNTPPETYAGPDKPVIRE